MSAALWIPNCHCQIVPRQRSPATCVAPACFEKCRFRGQEAHLRPLHQHGIFEICRQSAINSGHHHFPMVSLNLGSAYHSSWLPRFSKKQSGSRATLLSYGFDACGREEDGCRSSLQEYSIDSSRNTLVLERLWLYLIHSIHSGGFVAGLFNVHKPFLPRS